MKGENVIDESTLTISERETIKVFAEAGIIEIVEERAGETGPVAPASETKLITREEEQPHAEEAPQAVPPQAEPATRPIRRRVAAAPPKAVKKTESTPPKKSTSKKGSSRRRASAPTRKAV